MKFGIAGNPDKRELPDLVGTIVRRFEQEGVEYVLHDQLRKALKNLDIPKTRSGRFVATGKLATSCDILISLGGDGTILRLSRLVAKEGTPILGVNLGKLGFLAEVSLSELDQCLSELLKKQYSVEERMMLEGTTSATRSVYHALNEIVLDKAGSSRVLDIETYIGKEYLATFTGDGLIVSTPTGSTGYALANGGPIVAPSNSTILISPMCPHSLTIRPVLVPNDSILHMKISSAPSKVHFTADGQQEMFLTPPVDVMVKKAPFAVRLVKRRRTSYYDLLRRKLRWGTDIRQNSEH